MGVDVATMVISDGKRRMATPGPYEWRVNDMPSPRDSSTHDSGPSRCSSEMSSGTASLPCTYLKCA